MKLDKENGTALVELAIILPILLLIVFGICEFGWAMYVNNSLGNAAREGARVAVVTRPLAVDDPVIATRVKQCLSFSYEPADLNITNTAPPPNGNGDPVTVQVVLRFHTITSMFPMLENKQFKAAATMRYER